MKIATIFCTTLFAVLLATSCSTPSNTVKLKTANNASLTNQSWFLVSNNDVVKGLYDKDVSLIIDEQNATVSGFAGCNNFTATYTKSNGVISFFNVSETKMACPTKEKEKAFFSMLKNVNRYEINGKELLLYKGNILLMTFKTI